MVAKGQLLTIYSELRRAFGHQHWWPARTPFEVIVGAVLTQNTNWRNVEKAIRNLEEAGLLSARALGQADPRRLQRLIRPAGYYRQKAGRLLGVARWVALHCAPEDEGLCGLKARSTDELRRGLLSLSGIGPETADSILLYALAKPVFVVDAYTVRVMGRHGLIEPGGSYADVQQEFHDRLPQDVELLKDYHAQLVELGKRYCKKRYPDCARCPLYPLLGPPLIVEADL